MSWSARTPKINDQARRRRAKFWKILGHLREFGTVNRCLLINVYPPPGGGGVSGENQGIKTDIQGKVQN